MRTLRLELSRAGFTGAMIDAMGLVEAASYVARLRLEAERAAQAVRALRGMSRKPGQHKAPGAEQPNTKTLIPLKRRNKHGR